jgi:hypothetical protein
MGAVGADREQELEQELVARLVDVAERRVAVLGAGRTRERVSRKARLIAEPAWPLYTGITAQYGFH